MEYSAVIQPDLGSPFFSACRFFSLSQDGTFSSILAVQNTRVSPVLMMHDPSAYLDTLISTEQGRGSS
jgi:hypothetical protein